jgi:hypothetical protein
MTSFAVRLQEIADKTNRNADQFVRDVVEDIATKLIERSPVGDPALWQKPAPKGYVPGTFLANWQLGVNVIPDGETGLRDTDRSTSSPTLGTIIANIPEHPAGTTIFLANNVPYARTIEDGHSTQAPTGLVGLTAIEFQQSVAVAAAKIPA